MINEFIDLKEGINLVYGEAATGKTTLALMLANNYSKFSKVVYIDTETGFNIERFKQISQHKYKDCLKNIIIFNVKNFEEQNKIINSLTKLEGIALIIIDTIGIYYRLELKNDFKYANSKIVNMFKILKDLNKKGIHVFITNQVYSDFNTNKIQGVGGDMLKKFCNITLRLEKNPRKMIREKPSNAENFFDIRDEGICLK